MAGGTLFCCCPVSVVRCGTRILRFSKENSGVPSVAQVVQQSKRRRGLTGVMIVVRFELEPVGDGTNEWWRATCRERNCRGI